MNLLFEIHPPLLTPQSLPADANARTSAYLALKGGTLHRRIRPLISQPWIPLNVDKSSHSVDLLGEENRRRIPEVAVEPQRPIPGDTSLLIAMWEGYILSIANDSFVARLVPLYSTDKSDEVSLDHEAEFDLGSVSYFDRDLLEPGAVFYWSISYKDSVTGQRTTTSDLRFRRRPVWNEKDLRKAATSTLLFDRLLGLDEVENAPGRA